MREDWKYDACGQVRTYSTAFQLASEFTFNAADQLTSIADEDAGTEYSDTGEMTRAPEDVDVELEYNPAGQLTSGTAADGTEFTNVYSGATNATRLAQQTTAEHENQTGGIEGLAVSVVCAIVSYGIGEIPERSLRHDYPELF